MLTARQLVQLRNEPGAPNRLKAAMRIANTTQAAVSAATGIDQSSVSRIANSNGPGVTVQTASKLAAFFGCQISDLFPRETSVEARRAS
jgi:transcriptional regulator with XRE-family HTH domain